MDHVAANSFDLRPTDGLFYLNAFQVVVGDVVTLKQGSYTLPKQTFSPEITQIFTGNMFIATNSGERISDITTVPEPSTYALLALGVGVLGWQMRRLRTA